MQRSHHQRQLGWKQRDKGTNVMEVLPYTPYSKVVWPENLHASTTTKTPIQPMQRFSVKEGKLSCLFYVSLSTFLHYSTSWLQ